MNSKQLALHILDACEEKKGIDPIIIDIRKLTDIADYFVLVHGTSDRHVRTIADGVVDFLSPQLKPFHQEGMREAKWVLLDYGAVMVHVFYYETRGFYNLERLWGDGVIVKRKEKNAKPVKRTRRSNPS